MATIRVLAELTNRLSSGLNKIGDDATKLDVKLQGTASTTDKLQRKLTDLGKTVARAKVGVEGDREAMLQVQRMEDKLHTWGRQVGTGRAKIEGTGSVLTQISAMELGLDKLGAKTAEPQVKLKGTVAAIVTTGFLSHEMKRLRDRAAESAAAEGLLTVANLAVAASSLAAAAAEVTLEIATGALDSAIVANLALFAALAVVAAGVVIAFGPLIAAIGVITAGMAGLAAVAIPMLSDLKKKTDSIKTANDSFAAAARNVSQAIHGSTVDMKLYHDSFAGLTRGQQMAVKLLGNAKVTWESLTTAQRHQVIVLSQNKGELLGLLPAQKTALAALLASKKAYDELSPAQKKIQDSLTGLSDQWHKLTKAVQPSIMRLFASALRVVKDLMPALEPLIKAMARALKGFFDNIDQWLKSPSGKKFLHWLETQGPKDIAAFGRFIWNFARDVGSAFKWIVDKGTTLDKLLKERWRDVKVVSQDLRNWIWRDFAQKISNFFTNTIPAAAALLRDKVHLIWDQMIIHALHFLLNLTVAFGHLPGPLGAPFRKASANIRTELGHMADDVKRTVGKINGDLASLHGGSVLVQFRFPAGTISRLHQLHPGGYAAGTGSAPPGWAWTGEKGPELVRFTGGETVLNAAQSRRLSGFAAGTGDAMRFADKVPTAAAIDRVGVALQGVISRVIAGIRKEWGHIPAPPGFFRKTPGGGGGFGVPGPGGGAPGANAALARRMFPSVDFASWNYVAMRESGWNQFARNPSSGAYGIPQALPPSKMGPAANPPQSNVMAQLSWMVGYMNSRYGGAGGAAAHERAFNWYDGGGLLMPGWTAAFNGTGKPEMVTPMDAFMPMRQLVKVLLDPGGPMQKLTKALTHTGGWGGWGNLLWPQDHPWGGRAPHRGHTGGWGGWGNLTWPADHPWGGPHPGRTPSHHHWGWGPGWHPWPHTTPSRRHHTGGWGGWGNLTWPATHPWGGPHPGHTGGWGGWGNTTWPSGRWPGIGLGASGQLYMFGERGPETVTPVNGSFDGSADRLARIEKLLIAILKSGNAAPGRTGQAVLWGLQSGIRSSGPRSSSFRAT